MKTEKKLLNSSKPFAMILIYEFLFGKGMRGGEWGPFKAMMMRHKTRLNAELAKIKIKRGVKSNKDLIPKEITEMNEKSLRIPRYIRVNMIKATQEEVIEGMQKSENGQFEYLEECPELYSSEQAITEAVKATERTLKKRSIFWRDRHLPDLLACPPSVDLHLNPLYQQGKIILQDKASCFPAHALHPPEGSVVIDACAAPGNKTSHLSSLMNNTGKIYAFDLDRRRLDLMQRMISKAGCLNIETECKSFLETAKEDYQDVEYILLDPSCSGSGIVNRLDHLVDEGDSSGNKDRLQSLADFQLQCLLHALHFPNVHRVVYSTCSVHREENEEVVVKALQQCPCWHLTKRLPQWPHRGLPEVDGLTEQQADCLIRCDPHRDCTNGFFVACFERSQ